MADLNPELLAQVLRESLAKGKRPYVTVAGESMAPLLRRGDQVGLAPAELDALRPGDVIVYQGPYELTSHRYWGRSAEDSRPLLLTRGDRPAAFDAPAPADALVGRVVARRRCQRVLALDSGPGGWLNRRLADLARLEYRYLLSPNGRGRRPALHRRLARGMIYRGAQALAEAVGRVSSQAEREP
ncbi:MAG: hypothetical protein ACRDHL_05930 [Candidatus Promineifilaceae bacterium]